MISVLKMINKEIDLIDQELKKENKRLTFFREFFKNNSCISLSEVIGQNHSKLAIMRIAQEAPHLPIEAIEKLVMGNKTIFEEFDSDDIDELTKLLDNLYEDKETYKKAKEILISGKKTSIFGMFKKEEIVANTIRTLIDMMETTPENFCMFIDMGIANPHAIVGSLVYLTTLRKIKKEESIGYQIIEDYTQNEQRKMSGKEKAKLVSNVTKDFYNVKKLLEPIKLAREEYLSLEQEERNRRRTLTKNKTVYETLEKNLYDVLKAGEVRNINSLINKIPNESVRLAVLKLVYNHNQEIYTEKTKEYEELSANDASHYQVLLAKYGVSPETYDVGTVMDNSIDNLEEMLLILSKLNITNPQDLLVVAQNSNLETVQNIDSLVERKIITTSLLANHNSIFSPISKEYESLMRNLALINQSKINPHSFYEMDEVFIIPHQRFAENIKCLEEYELLPNIKKGLNLKFLKDPGLSEAIDTLLELGYEKNLEEYLDLLNYKEKFGRLRILKELNIPAIDTQTLLEILTTDKFYISDCEISKYIYNAAEHSLPKTIIELEENETNSDDLEKLANFNNTTRTYSFNGVIISKNKVHKNLAKIISTGNPEDRIVYSVLKNSVLTDEQVIKVVASLTTQESIGTVKEKK